MFQSTVRTTAWLLAAFLAITMTGTSQAGEDGYKSLFDGKSLKGWDGDPTFWSVKDGVIDGRTTKENPTKGNTFLVYTEDAVADFELKLEYKITTSYGNSGVQYRSFPRGHNKWKFGEPWPEKAKYRVGGYQADMEAGKKYSGILYGEAYRGILCLRGQETVIGDNHKPKTVGKVGDSNEIQSKIKAGDWNEYHITAKGFKFTHRINGVVTAICTDEDKEQRRVSGALALQLHAGPPMHIQFRNIRIKCLGKQGAAADTNDSKDLAVGPTPLGASLAAPLVTTASNKKKIVIVAGRASHGYGAHEFNAGALLIKKLFKEAMPNDIEVDVHHNGWPKVDNAFDGADAVVFFCNGGGGHVVMPHLKEFDKVVKKGVGLACLHYGVEVPKGEPGRYFLDWIGGYFEPHWSVNPHWTAKFTKFNKHEITQGVGPFAINDEWYYHMRFQESMKGVTPVLSAMPGPETLKRGDGAHSGNPHVRKAVLDRKEEQHVAWAYVRPDGSRGFGFTGLHSHWNWEDDNFRKLVLNGLAWTAKVPVPAKGVETKTPTQEDLEANQDYPKRGQRKPAAKKPVGKINDAKALFSKTVTKSTPGHAVDIDVDIKGSKELYLVVGDNGDGYGCDWADWAEPRLVDRNGKEHKLTEMKWKSAGSGWGQIRINKNVQGQPLKINGKEVAYGIGAHAVSVIAYDLPKGHNFDRFKARGGLDNGGSDQGCGSTVKFMVFNSKPPVTATRSSQGGGGSGNGGGEPANAVETLDVAEGLEATLFASEPMMVSPTNIDVDAQGRVWLCEVVNYRRNNGKRPEGDRIMVLEDSNGDGKADKSTIFYQGRDVDSAMGIAVLDNKIIVTCSPNVFVFTDKNRNLKFDEGDTRDVLFTNTGGPQHDHSAHSFLFGPDGRLYWNFGNTGRHVHDKNGKIVVDQAGNEVRDARKPYIGGMVFRCEMDGSNFETLGHNFRNNYEVTVDSFGSLWQSDNDDDGNKGVRINYVMEYGNYGYKDEFTGKGWRDKRANMPKDVPTQHWYQNSPGVVPNFVQTGAGSPTGITVYEGRLLPKVFWDQVIHCDAGPNVVRAYPATKVGAGYTGTMENILLGARDRWFRPADVAVAPDGSLFVSDWYDPGVGGHNMRDLERGRIFRVAPPGHKYTVPKINLDTPQGAVEALKSPNYAIRYLAWTALNQSQGKAKSALEGLAKDNNPRFRARALWLLAAIKGNTTAAIDQAIADKDEDIRAVAIRIARRHNADVIGTVRKLVKDSSALVRRECAIALRHSKASEAAELWAELAGQHDGKDRWYLEALGIAADRNEDAFFAAWEAKVGDKWNTAAGRDIVWRMRSDKALGYLVKILKDPKTPAETHPKYMRAFDFHSGAAKDAALLELLQ